MVFMLDIDIAWIAFMIVQRLSCIERTSDCMDEHQTSEQVFFIQKSRIYIFRRKSCSLKRSDLQ